MRYDIIISDERWEEIFENQVDNSENLTMESNWAECQNIIINPAYIGHVVA